MKRVILAFAYAIVLALSTFTIRLMVSGSPASGAGALSPAPSAPATNSSTRPPLPRDAQVARNTGLVENYGRLPLSFEANHGQTDPQVPQVHRRDGDD